jgi:pyruvate dehydrogenase E1 component beta subunit
LENYTYNIKYENDTIREPFVEAMSEEMRNDESIYLMGGKFAEYNGLQGIKGMLAEFGEKSDRYSIAELGFTGWKRP